jgi:hypothetical protein
MGPWVLAQPLDVGQPENEVSTCLVRNQGMRPAVGAKYTMRIGVEPRSCEERETLRGRKACLVRRANTFSHRSACVSRRASIRWLGLSGCVDDGTSFVIFENESVIYNLASP